MVYIPTPKTDEPARRLILLIGLRQKGIYYLVLPQYPPYIGYYGRTFYGNIPV